MLTVATRSRSEQWWGKNCHSEVIPAFLMKTYEILENMKYSHIICWTRNGEGFIVRNIKEFSETVLPLYFRHSNYTSFVRQLNMYDFHKIRQENQQNAFKNSLFRRGQSYLLKEIQRKDYLAKKQAKETPKEIQPAKQQETLRHDIEVQHLEATCRKKLKLLQKSITRIDTQASNLAGITEADLQSQETLIQVIDSLFGLILSNKSASESLGNFSETWASEIHRKMSSVKESKGEQQIPLPADAKTFLLSSVKVDTQTTFFNSFRDE